MPSTRQETRVRLSYTEKGKTKSTVLEEERAQGWIEELTADNETASVEASQTYTYHNVSVESSSTDFEELVPNPQERADLINTALDLKAQGFIRKTMLAKDFTPTEGSYDLHDIYNIVTERKSASPEEKAANALSKLLKRSVSVDELASILEGLGATA